MFHRGGFDEAQGGVREARRGGEGEERSACFSAAGATPSGDDSPGRDSSSAASAVIFATAPSATRDNPTETPPATSVTSAASPRAPYIAVAAAVGTRHIFALANANPLFVAALMIFPSAPSAPGRTSAKVCCLEEANTDSVYASPYHNLELAGVDHDDGADEEVGDGDGRDGSSSGTRGGS